MALFFKHPKSGHHPCAVEAALAFVSYVLMVQWSGTSLIYHCVNVAIFTSLSSQAVPGSLAQGKFYMNECSENGNQGAIWGVWIVLPIVNHSASKISRRTPSNMNSTYLFFSITSKQEAVKDAFSYCHVHG